VVLHSAHVVDRFISSPAQDQLLYTSAVRIDAPPPHDRDDQFPSAGNCYGSRCPAGMEQTVNNNQIRW
jgi:hypothetical protein